MRQETVQQFLSAKDYIKARPHMTVPQALAELGIPKNRYYGWSKRFADSGGAKLKRGPKGPRKARRGANLKEDPGPRVEIVQMSDIEDITPEPRSQRPGQRVMCLVGTVDEIRELMRGL